MNNIIFVFPSLKTGGGNRVMVELANHLSLSRPVIVVYPLNTKEENKYSFVSNVTLIGIGLCSDNKLIKLLNIFFMYLFINKYRNSYIIYSDPFLSIFSIAIFNQKKYRFIQADDYRIFDDGFLLKKKFLINIYKYLCLKSYNYQNSFFFNSTFVYNTFCLDSQRKDIEYRLVYPAIDNSIFKIKSNRDYLTNALNICLVARNHPLKGFVNFINVWKRLDSQIKKSINNVYLITQDDLSDFDLEMMTVLNPKNDLEIVDIYNNSQIFISTSWCEGFGLPPLEAMACGCACIISDSGGVSEYAINGENCVMYPPKNEDELLAKLIMLIEDEKLRYTLSQNGLETAKVFSWDKSANQLMKVLNL